MTTLLDKLLGAPQASLSLTDPAGWSGIISPTASGIAVSPESALKVSTFWACVGLLSDTVGMLPCLTIERLANGDKRRAINHPLYDLLHDQPNAQQTSFEFFQMGTAHLLMRGNSYSQIVPGARGAVDQLLPMPPHLVEPDALPSGVMRYRYQGRTLNDDDVLHVRGLTLDGRVGLSVVGYARESLGMALAAEAYGARFFGNDSRPGGVLKHKGELKPPAAKRLKESWEAAHAQGNQGRVAVLEEGMEWQSTSMDNKDAQFLESREYQAEDICRWFRVPPHMVGLTSKATSWGSGIEQMSIGFVTYTLMPWLVRWQQAISRDLIIATQKYYVEFLTDALLRGDLLARYNAYAIGRNNGWLNVDEIRERENMNRLAGGQGQVYLQPLNMAPAGAEADAAAGAPDMSADKLAGAVEHYRQLLGEAAGRVIRREVKAVQRLAEKSQASDWAAEVQAFYSEHVAFVTAALGMSADKAAEYCRAQQQALLAEGPATMADWESRRAADLVALAVREESSWISV